MASKNQRRKLPKELFEKGLRIQEKETENEPVPAEPSSKRMVIGEAAASSEMNRLMSETLPSSSRKRGRPKSDVEMVTVSLRVPAEYIPLMKAVADQRLASRNAVMVDALKSYLKACGVLEED